MQSFETTVKMASNFLDSTVDSLIQLISVAEAIRECEEFMHSVKNKTFENNNLQQNCDVSLTVVSLN